MCCCKIVCATICSPIGIETLMHEANLSQTNEDSVSGDQQVVPLVPGRTTGQTSLCAPSDKTIRSVYLALRYMYICMYVGTYVRTYVCTYVRMYIYIYIICICVCDSVIDIVYHTVLGITVKLSY